MGPYENENQIFAEPMPREVNALHDAGRVRSGDSDRLVRNTILRHLFGAFDEAGVALGTYDRRKLEWLAGWETSTAQLVIDWVQRAHAAGLLQRAAEKEMHR